MKIYISDLYFKTRKESDLMKLVFLTNMLSHYQLSLAREFIKFYGDDYRVIVTKPFGKGFLAMGIEDLNQMPFVIRAYESQENMQLAKKLILESEHLIIGGTPMDPFWDIIEQRIKNGKILFEYSERIFKGGVMGPNKLRKIKMLLASRFSPLKKHIMRRKYKGSHTIILYIK